MNVIEVNNLNFSYNSKDKVLDNLTFAFQEGKYYSIIGHNGSGKSTLAKLLIGLLGDENNSLKAFGLEYNEKNISLIRNRIGIVFQNPDNQFIASTVRDDIAFGLENRCVKQEEMDEIIDFFLDEVNMKEYENKEPEMLSGGQKQRVAIAGILAMSPDVIIFDEATAMLDPVGKKEIYELISKLRMKNPKLTIISITHDIEEAFNSDEIMVLDHGKLFAFTTPEELLKRDQELQQIGLNLPFLYRINKELNNRGININEYKDIDKMVELLCK